MEFLQLKYFCEAAELENFSKTAKNNMVPVSDISQTIKRLETELGTKLFEHYANKIILNENGKAFYRAVSSALSTIDIAIEHLKTNNDELNGEIKICSYTNRQLITEAIKDYKKAYPNIAFSLNHSLPNNDYDIVISDTIMDSDIYYKEALLSEKILLAANKDVYKNINENNAISDLCNERFISFTPKTSLYNITMKICEENGFTPNIVIYDEDPYYSRKYIELGLGISFVPSISWKNQFSDKIKLLDICNYTRKTYLYIKKNKHSSKRIEEFVKFLHNKANMFCC